LEYNSDWLISSDDYMFDECLLVDLKILPSYWFLK
jgi:hypothetical protein